MRLVLSLDEVPQPQMPDEVVQVSESTQSESKEAEDPEHAEGYEFVCPRNSIGLTVHIDHDQFVPPELDIGQGDEQNVVHCENEGHTQHHRNVTYGQYAFVHTLRAATCEQEGSDKDMQYINWSWETY
jgi:hypothetical protein